MPFGRTGVLIGAHDAPSPELSYGHDLKGTPLYGVSKIGIFVVAAAERDCQFEKTMVGLGRTDVSIPPF